jgi:mannose-6-phosphate isomerase-like protein (cupin superfamily)
MPSAYKFEEQKAQQDPISLERACSALAEHWSPRVVGRVNNQYIKVAKVLGEFPWHSHEHEDEMFLVLRGQLRIGRAEADGGAVLVRPGEFFVVPRGATIRLLRKRRGSRWWRRLRRCIRVRSRRR